MSEIAGIELKPIVSSNLDAAGYDAATKTLVVRFKSGASYKYPNFDPALYAAFETQFSGDNGKSAGKFFHANIKNLPCKKVTE